MNLDPRRSAIINSARLLIDAGNNLDQLDSITIGILGALGLRSVSPGKWETARTVFDELAAVVAAFDYEEDQLGPWKSDVENGVHSPEWGEVLRLLADTINATLDWLLDFADQHGRPVEDLFDPEDVKFLDSLSKVLAAKARTP